MPLVPPRIHIDCDPGDEATAAVLDLDVVSWRFDQLTEAGYPVDVAISLAERSDVDLHRACEMLERGAGVGEALRILT